MNYEKRFKRFTAELLVLIEKHLHEWDEAERGIYDIDEIMERIEAESEEPTHPVIYSQNTKKSANRKSSRYKDFGE